VKEGIMNSPVSGSRVEPVISFVPVRVTMTFPFMFPLQVQLQVQVQLPVLHHVYAIAGAPERVSLLRRLMVPPLPCSNVHVSSLAMITPVCEGVGSVRVMNISAVSQLSMCRISQRIYENW
jgi:hypothetical protein